MSGLERIVIKAGAGTGKTFHLVQEYGNALGMGAPENVLPQGPCSPEEIIAVTFTRKAAAELRDRVRRKLHQAGRPDLAEKAEGALIGTVDGICLRLIQEYALDAGFSPLLRELAEEDGQRLFDEAQGAVFDRRDGEEGSDLPSRYHAFGMYDTAANPEEGVESEPVWQAVVRALAEHARVHGFDRRAMEEAAEASCREFVSFLVPGAGAPDLAGLKRRIGEARREQCRDKLYRPYRGARSASTQRHFNLLEKLDVMPFEDMRWKDWFLLARADPKPKGGESAPPFREVLHEIAFDACRSREFREDACRLIRESFRAASEVVERFEQLKREAGVLDFTDMERRAVELLSLPRVQQAMRGRFRVLFVDEYQDTSPLQLRIFQLLGHIIENGEKKGRVIYVGDDKQSIYGFRGAAPELTRAGTPRSAGGRTLWKHDTLTVCWRSLPAVTEFVNAFFSSLEDRFGRNFLEQRGRLDIRHMLSDEAAALRRRSGQQERSGASRERQLAVVKAVPSLQVWHLGLSEEGMWNNAGRAAAVAEMVKRSLDGSMMVEKKSGQDVTGLRPLVRGDIAVLCRTHSQCRAVADALSSRGIPAKLRRGGLLEQEEVRLCLYACRLAADLHDVPAMASLYRLLVGGDWFAAAASGEGGLFHPLFEPLGKLHEDMVRLSPSELLDAVIRDMDVFRRAAAWGNLQERAANIELLRDCVRRYEQTARAARRPLTLQGWLDELEEEAPERACVGEDAVSVWTCHESKGLESPMVVLYGLSGRLREPSVWGVRRICELEGFTGEQDPLERCSFRWLPDILKRAFPAGAGIPPCLDPELLQRRFGEAEQSLRDEELRLLYVAMTRPKSILALVTETVSEKGGEETVAPALCTFSLTAGRELAALVEGGGDGRFLGIPCRVLRMFPEEVRSGEQNGNGADRRFPVCGPALAGSFAGERGGSAESAVSAVWRERLRHGPVEGVPGDAPRDRLGDMLHGWFAVWFGMEEQQRRRELASGRMRERLERFCALWNEPEPLWPDASLHLEALSENLAEALQHWFEGRADKRPGDALVVRTEWPVERLLGDEGGFRTDAMRLDLLAEVLREDGSFGPCLMVDHKCGRYEAFAEETALAEHLCAHYGKRQSEYVRALRAMGRECRALLHLPLEGRMLELCVPEEA